MKRVPKILRVSLFLLLLGTCGLQIARNATAEPVTRPSAKDNVTAAREAISRVGGVDVKASMPETTAVVGGNGVVEPAQQETRVAAQVTAVVQKLLVREGQRVKAGETLALLSNGVELAALQAAEADLKAERANLERSVTGLRQEDRDAAQAESEAARARAALSKATLVRSERLAGSGAITAEELEKAKGQTAVDEATFKAIDARLRAAFAGSRVEDVAFAKARVSAAEARVAQARATLARLEIKAPQAGEVLQLKIREGELYSFQGTEPLLVLGDTSSLQVRMDVDERDVGRLELGATAYVMADAFGGRKFAGTVVEVGRRFGRKNIRTDDPLEKNDTKVLEVVIKLDEPGTLIPGQRVTSFIQASKPRS